MAKPAPNAVDVQEFQFKLHAKLKIFNNRDPLLFNKPSNLIATASRFGLVFLGSSENALIVVTSKTIEPLTLKDGEVDDFPCREIPLPSRVLWLSVNCDSTVLAVIIEKDTCPWCIFYDVTSFWKQQIRTINEVRLSATPGVHILETNWNPTLPTTFTACKSDGSLGCYELKETGLEINELPMEAKSTSFCWSPKGKQIAVGSATGTITQYKPDLRAVKVINPPALEGNPSLISLQWVSNYQFIGVYKCLNNPDSQANLLVVDAPKTGEVSYTNYEDVCYSSGSGQAPQFYMHLSAAWNTLIVASSTSMEVGVLGMERDCWIQWILGDAARAELPLTATRQDTLPVGFGFDTAYTQPIPWGESAIPPFPMLLLISNEGLLLCFRTLNLKGNLPSVCHAPEMLPDMSGAGQFVIRHKETKPPPTTAPLAFSLPKTIEETKAPPVLFPPTTTQTLFAPAPPIPVTKAEPIKPQTPEIPQSPVSTPINLTEDLKKESEAALKLLIQEECETLDAEVGVLLQSARALKIDLGTDEEAVNLVQGVDDLQKHTDDLNELRQTLTGNLFQLKQDLIQSWAWFEDARSRHIQSQDPVVEVLRKNQPLDRVLQSHSTSIDHRVYYIESQVKELRAALDEQWENFQEKFKASMKYKVPNIEAIYHTMIRHQGIVQKQRYLLKDISNRIKNYRTKSGGTSVLVALEKADNLERELRRLCLQPNVVNAQYEKLLEDQRKFTGEKQEMLRGLLKGKKLNVVHVNKPQLSTDYLQTIATPASTPKVLPVKKSIQEPFTSLLGAAMSPIATSKTSVARNLNFVQSTPKPEVVVSKATPTFSWTNLTTTITTKTTASSAFVPTINFSTTKTVEKPSGSTFTFGGITPMSTSSLAVTNTNTTVMFGSTVTSATLPSFNTAATAPPFATSGTPLQFKQFTPPKAVVSTQAPTTVASTKPVFVATNPPKILPKNNATFTITSLMNPTTLVASKPVVTTRIFTSTSTTPIKSDSITLTPITTTKPEAQSRLYSIGKSLIENAISTPPTKPTLEVAATPNEPFVFTPPTQSTEEVKPTIAQAVTTSTTSLTFGGSSSVPEGAKTVPSTGNVTSLFGGTVTTAANVTPVTSSMFGSNSKATSMFSFTSANVTPTSIATTSTPSMFGSAFGTTITTASLFGTKTTSTTSTPSMFGSTRTPTPSTSVFGNTVTTSTVTPTFGGVKPFGTPPVTTSPFGTPTITTSPFGTSTANAPAFATAPTTSTIFGGAVATSAPTFGTPVFGTSQVPSLFGVTPITQTQTPPTFGTPTTTSNLFGAKSAPVSTASSPFGAATSNTNVFGAASAGFAQSQSQGNTFGSPVFGQTTSANVFGNSNAFGGGGGQSGMFGSTFGTATSSFGASPSVFSSPTNTAPFGTAPAAQSAQTFDNSFSFASAGVPTTTASAFGTSSGFGFGGATSPNAFSFGSLNVGTTAASAFGASTFGQPQQSAQNPFAKADTKPAFGSGSVFGTPPASTSSSIFGGGSSGNVFGNTTGQGQGFGTATFGNQNAFGQSTFGQQGAFGSPQTGPFSGGNSSVAQTGFGAFGQQAQQKPGGFGSPPAFGGGSSPGAFGAAPAFGNTAAFGSPSFGGQSKVFGSPNTNTFGNTNSPQTSSFGNLAGQSTLGFGSLAQQTPSPSAQPSFSGGSSFSTWR